MGKLDELLKGWLRRRLWKRYLSDPENVRLPERFYRPPTTEDRVAKRMREEEELTRAWEARRQTRMRIKAGQADTNVENVFYASD